MYSGICIVGGIAIAVGIGILLKGKMGEELELQQQHWKSEEGTRTSVWSGKRLHEKTWEPSESPPRLRYEVPTDIQCMFHYDQRIRIVLLSFGNHGWALLYLAHGVGEHMGRYERLGQFLADNGILVYGHDHVGHGQSEGVRVHIETFHAYTEDVIQHVEHMKERYPDTPSLLMGHSMGGLIAAHTALRRQDLFTGLLLSAPCVEVDPREAGPFLRFLARLLAFFFPKMGIKAIDTDYISSISEEVKLYVEDPLVYHGALKAGWSVAFMNSMAEVRSLISKLTLPLFIMHGGDDHMVPLSASQFIHDNAASQDKTFQLFEGNRHEVLHDREQERARQLIKDWVLGHCNPPSQQQPQE